MMEKFTVIFLPIMLWGEKQDKKEKHVSEEEQS